MGVPGAAGRAAVQLTCPCTGRGERGGGRHPERSALAGRPTALRLLPCTAWVLPQEKLEAFIDNVAVPPALIHGIVQASEGGSRAEVCVLAPRSTGHPGASRCTNCCPAAAGRDRRRFCGAPQSAECQARVGGQRRERQVLCGLSVSWARRPAPRGADPCPAHPNTHAFHAYTPTHPSHIPLHPGMWPPSWSA